MPTARTIAREWRRRGVERPLAAALGAAMGRLADRVASEAPEVTGELRDSVRATPVKVTPRRISAAVVVSSDHALAVEYGTEDMDARPYMRPACRAERPRIIATVQDAARHNRG